MALIGYYPEMGGKKNDNVFIKASLSHYGRHYFVTSKHPIEIKQGIKFERQTKESDYVSRNHPEAGWYKYIFTNKAFDKFIKMHDVNYEMLLD